MFLLFNDNHYIYDTKKSVENQVVCSIVFGENIRYKTGTNNSVKNVDINNPPIIVHPIGAHREPPRKVSGSKPPTVVAVVKMIGVNRISPACFNAVTMSFPYLVLFCRPTFLTLD
jgi:hypothetical protein